MSSPKSENSPNPQNPSVPANISINVLSKYSLNKNYLEQYVRMLNGVNYDVTSTGNVSILANELIKQLQSISDDPNHKIFLLIDKQTDTLYGCGTLLIERKLTNNFKNIGHIEDICIKDGLDADRSNRYYNMILNYINDYASKNNCYRTILRSDQYVEVNIKSTESIEYPQSTSDNLVFNTWSNLVESN